eukprot:6184787-Pleurochrysis_carterae.AAC.4
MHLRSRTYATFAHARTQTHARSRTHARQHTHTYARAAVALRCAHVLPALSQVRCLGRGGGVRQQSWVHAEYLPEVRLSAMTTYQTLCGWLSPAMVQHSCWDVLRLAVCALERSLSSLDSREQARAC